MQKPEDKLPLPLSPGGRDARVSGSEGQLQQAASVLLLISGCNQPPMPYFAAWSEGRLFFFLFVFNVSARLDSMRKPNLIFFLTDQQRADTMACYGNHRVHAPNLNKLAAESAVFERTYVTQPLCTPSRASLFTGLWPHATNCTRNGVSLDRRYLTFAELLGDQDYHPGYMGKWQLGDELLQQRGFREWISTEGVSDYSRFL